MTFNEIIRREKYNITTLKPCLDLRRRVTAESSPERDFWSRRSSSNHFGGGNPGSKGFLESQRPTAASERKVPVGGAFGDTEYSQRKSKDRLDSLAGPDENQGMTFFEDQQRSYQINRSPVLGNSEVVYPFEKGALVAEDEIIIHPYETLGKLRMNYPRFGPTVSKAVTAKDTAQAIEDELRSQKSSDMPSIAITDKFSRLTTRVSDTLETLESKAGLSKYNEDEAIVKAKHDSSKYFGICTPGRSEAKKVYDCKLNCKLYTNPADNYIPTHCSVHCACKQPAQDTRKYHEINSTKPLGSVSYQLHQQKCLSHSENLDEPLSNPTALRNKQRTSQGPDAATLLLSSLSATLSRLTFWKGRIKSISARLISQSDVFLPQAFGALIGQTQGEPILHKSLFPQLLNLIGFRISDKIQSGLTRDTLFALVDQDQDNHIGVADFVHLFSAEMEEVSLSNSHSTRIRSVSGRSFTSEQSAPKNHRELTAEFRVGLAELLGAWAEFAELTRLAKLTLTQYYLGSGKNLKLVPRTQICKLLQEVAAKNQDTAGDCGHENKHYSWEEPSRPQFISKNDVGFIVDNLLLLVA